MRLVRILGVASVVAVLATTASAAKVTVTLRNGEKITGVGAFLRWDEDGNARKQPNKDAKIDKPEVEVSATRVKDNVWEFGDLPPGKYDIVLMGDHLRIEGFTFAAVQEFDPVFPGDSKLPDQDAAKWIDNHIRNSPHYENKVEPLYIGGDKKAARILVQLIRDLPTSYTPGAGTMRHEIWQYSFNYGGWQKERRTRVLHRHILQVSDLRQWTWVWEPKLGGIEVKKSTVKVNYDVPAQPDPTKLKGLYPY